MCLLCRILFACCITYFVRGSQSLVFQALNHKICIFSKINLLYFLPLYALAGRKLGFVAPLLLSLSGCILLKNCRLIIMESRDFLIEKNNRHQRK